MRIFKRKVSVALIVLCFSALFFGCESNFKEVQKINFAEFTPVGEADEVNLKYTDSGKIVSVLVTPKMLDFNGMGFPFTEFPKGIDVTLYDSKAKKTLIRSDYAVSYKETGMIDLQGKVKITSSEGQVLETEQLYFDQKNEWFFTEKKFKVSSPKGISFGQGIDFSKDFKVVNSQRLTGELKTDE